MDRGRPARSVRILIIGLIFLITGCNFAEPTPFVVSPDEDDFITYQFGGGELGADFTEVTIRGDGHVAYRYLLPYTGTWPQEEITRENQLSPAETEAFFQALVDGGIFGLESQASQGADVPRTTITIHLDERELEVNLDGTPEPAIHNQFTNLIEQFYPTAACQVNDLAGNFEKMASGASQAEVTLCLGQPAEINEYSLPAAPFFGPAEALTSLIEPGTPVEEWLYYGDDQTYYLWFTAPSNEPAEQWLLVGTAVYPTGAVFEAE